MDETHQFGPVLDSLASALKDASDLNPAFLTPTQAGEVLLAWQRIQAGVAELGLRVMASGPAQVLAEETGARDVAAWLTANGALDVREAHAQLRLAHALERHEATRAALAEGRLDVAQARVITTAVDDLAEVAGAAGAAGAEGVEVEGVDAEVRERAEEHLVGLAATHGPRELRRLASHLIEVVAPQLAEDADARVLARLEQQAARKATLSITPAGDGLARLHALVPETVGERLRLLVEAYAQPRIAALDADGEHRPRSRILAEAFAQLLETLDPDRVPAHGGDATTIMVTIDHHQLTQEIATAQLGGLGGGVPVTAAEARRLACTAKILPAVLNGHSLPLDLGRTQRLFTPAQRKALRLRDKTCRAEGCTVPAEWCDAHHLLSWATGGTTDLTNGILLCGHHHRRAHDPTYDLTRLANGDYRFHRRT